MTGDTQGWQPIETAPKDGACRADLVTMTRAQLAVLDRMADDLGYPFRDIAMDCGLTVPAVRKIIRHFHDMGMTGYGPLYSEDEPAICGAGYWLSRCGWDLQSRMRRALSWRELDAIREPAECFA